MFVWESLSKGSRHVQKTGQMSDLWRCDRWARAGQSPHTGGEELFANYSSNAAESNQNLLVWEDKTLNGFSLLVVLSEMPKLKWVLCV